MFLVKEVKQLDFPAMICYILKQTGKVGGPLSSLALNLALI